MNVTLEWDDAKRAANIAKHGVDFTEAERFDLANADTIPPIVRGERRYRSFGRIGDRLYAMVWTRRGDAVRVISLRKANSREERRHGQAVQRRSG